MTDDNAAVYLTRPEPSPKAQVLIHQVESHTGREVPWWMFAEVAVRLDDARAWIAERSGLERKMRRHAWAALLALAGNLVLLAGGIATHLKAQGAAEEREAQRDRSFLEYRDSVRRDMDRMEQDIRDLRRDLRRLSGADRIGPDSTERRRSDNKFTALDALNAALASTAPPPLGKIDTASCFQVCNSNAECGGSQQFCRFCNFGECRSTRPESPPPDAGIDATAGGTTP